MRKQKGVTLVSLVVTIIVLIILATITINATLGENGIITIAKRAKENMELAQQQEQTELNQLYTSMEAEGGISGDISYDAIAMLAEFREKVAEAITNKGVATSKTDSVETVVENIGKLGAVKEISEVEKYRDAGTYMTEKTTVKDSNGNLIEVPEGFKIAEDSGINVTEGIVIEDNDIIDGIGNNRGNQYVWIPVGEGIKKSDGTTVDITLGRYVFADGTNDLAEDGTTVLTKGTPILMQSAENYLDETVIDTDYQELVTSRTGVASSGSNALNTTALDLKGFIDSAKSNGGYYIARYEASYGADGKANSKVSDTYGTSAPTSEGALWNCITELGSAVASRNLYTTTTTDLINSYAWDTAIVYIEEFSGDEDYSYQYGQSISTSLTNTGVNGDEKCKINDMASNTAEWITEYTKHANNPCTNRGSYYDNINHYTSRRNYSSSTYSFKNITFRVVLYI